MIPIIVKGKGLIPRLGRLAPILQPFNINKGDLMTIVRTPKNMSPITAYYVHPETKREVEVTIKNFNQVWNNHQLYIESLHTKANAEKLANTPIQQVIVVEEKIPEPVIVEETKPEIHKVNEDKEPKVEEVLYNVDETSSEDMVTEEVVEEKNESSETEETKSESNNHNNQNNYQAYRKNNNNNHHKR